MITILLVDDKVNHLKAIKDALSNEIRECEINNKEIQIETYQFDVESADEKQLNSLVDNIKAYCDMDSDTDNRVLLVIDLALIQGLFSIDELKRSLMYGILLKRYVANELKSDRKNIDEHYEKNVKYLFMSIYLDTDTQLSKFIRAKISKENSIGLVKPKIMEQVDGKKFICEENESASDIVDVKQIPDMQYREEIIKLYEKKTIYGNFIATILKTALLNK